MPKTDIKAASKLTFNQSTKAEALAAKPAAKCCKGAHLLGLLLFGQVFSEREIRLAAENEAVKKKIDEELTLYFPDVFDSSTEKEYHDIMKRRTQAMLDAVIEGETAERTAEIERLTDELVCFTKPRTFIGKDSTEIAYDRQFDEMCIMIGQQLNTDAKKYTVSEYYSAYQYIKKQQNKQKRQK